MSNCKHSSAVIDVVTINSKGKIVIPKELRKKLDIKPDSKLDIITIEKEGNVQCIVMIKADDLSGEVGDALRSAFGSAVNRAILKDTHEEWGTRTPKLIIRFRIKPAVNWIWLVTLSSLKFSY